MIKDPNVAGVDLVASVLDSLMDELVLVGGCAVGLLITDMSRPPVRATGDIDLLTEVTPRSSYYEFCEELKLRGFVESDEVICRWKRGEIKLDVMTTDPEVLGFSNSWYEMAARQAERHVLPSGRSIRVISAPVFIATKLESFRSRGAGDYLHHDMEDIVTVLDGRPGICEEVRLAPLELREYVADEFEAISLDQTFYDRLDWLLGGESHRKPIVLDRLRKIIDM